MNAIERLRARIGIAAGPADRADKTDNTLGSSAWMRADASDTTDKSGFVSFVSPCGEGREKLDPANDADALEPVGVVTDDAGLPAFPCATCGCGSFHQAPGDRWRCAACEPATREGITGGAFCAVPGGEPVVRAPLGWPPGWQNWPEERTTHERRLPDPNTAPLGTCLCCGFLGPRSETRLCGACIYQGKAGP